MTNSNFKDWIKINSIIVENHQHISEVKCPNCQQFGIDYQYVGDKNSRGGFLDIWCNSCLHGIHISRTKVPEHLSMISFEEVDAYKSRVPRFTTIEP